MDPLTRLSELQSNALTRSTLEGLAEEQKLDLIVDGEHTSSGNTTENVGTGTLEQRPDTFSGNDLATSIERRLVLDSLELTHQQLSRMLEEQCSLLHQKSSSYVDGWYPVGTSRHRHL